MTINIHDLLLPCSGSLYWKAVEEGWVCYSTELGVTSLMGPESKLVIEQLAGQAKTFNELVSIFADDGPDETGTENTLRMIVEALVLSDLVRVQKSA